MQGGDCHLRSWDWRVGQHRQLCTPLKLRTVTDAIQGSVIGPPLLKALQSKIPGKVNYQGVPYPADAAVSENHGHGRLVTKLIYDVGQCQPRRHRRAHDGLFGSASVATMSVHQDRALGLFSRWIRRPQGSIFPLGHSSSGWYVFSPVPRKIRNEQIPDKVFLAVIFGDPQNGQAVANVPAADLKEYCAQGDGVCGTPRTYQITPAHLSYGNNAADAANFIATVTGTS